MPLYAAFRHPGYRYIGTPTAVLIFSIFYPGIFHFLVVVKHSALFTYIPGILYRTYWNIAIYTHLVLMYVVYEVYVQQYTWYPSIIRRMVFITRYSFSMCATDV